VLNGMAAGDDRISGDHATSMQAVEALLAARRTGHPLSALPPGTVPTNDGEAYAIQDRVAARLGPVAGWKVGATSPTAEPFRAALHATTLWADGDRLPATRFRRIGIEAEIVYRLARDLPPRDQPYARPEVLGAVASMHPAIEIIDSRFAALTAVDTLSQRADQQNHGALAVGPGLSSWTAIDPTSLPVRLTIEEVVRAEGTGGNSAVDPVRLLVWLANHGSRSLGGLRAGQVVTTGSCTGTIFVRPGTRARAAFAGLGSIEIDIA
jgi:2-keto-4-pentenoate hydratase